jgi:hypothetical protein
MSPAGISMFHGAFARETCVSETYDLSGKNHHGTFSVFKNLRELTLLDMTKVPPTPSVFELESREMRHNIRFLHSFLQDFTKPVAKDGREHIEYVPTQVISEYVRHVLKLGGNRVDGIVYSSSRRKGHEACVLFFDAGAFALTPAQITRVQN